MALKRIGVQGQLTVHDMHSLASTALNEEGFDADLIEAALANVDNNSVRPVYDRADYVGRRRAMMERWSQHIWRTRAIGDSYDSQGEMEDFAAGRDVIPIVTR